MDTSAWISAAIPVVSATGRLSVLIVLHRSLRGRSDTSLAHCLKLFGILLAASAVNDLLMAPRFGAVSQLGIAITSLFILVAAIRLTRLLPRAIAFQARDHVAAAAEELRACKDRFERALYGSANGLWEWNMADNVFWFAPRFRELLGHATEEAFPNSVANWDATLHPDDKPRFVAAVDDHLKNGAPIELEFRLKTASGDYRWFAARGVAIRNGESVPTLISGAIQDIHDRKLAEKELRRMQEYSVQKHKMESLGELASSVAHEFNNMIQAIDGQLQFASRAAPVKSRARREIAVASKLVRQSSRVCRRLLTFSRRRSSASELLNPNVVLTRLAAMLRPLVGDGVGFQVSRTKGLGRIHGDSVAIQQILCNFCVNARDAMPNGGKLTVATSSVDLNAEEASRHPGAFPGNYVIFSVSDTGQGISEEARARIFDPFYTTKGNGKGTGLGLSIAAGIAAELGGFVDFDSQVGAGSTFRLWMPAVSAVKRCKRENGQRVTPSLGAQASTILYAEDDKHVRRNTIHLLQEHGYEVIAAHNGAEAVEQFFFNADRIDVALLDYNMPGMNGVTAARRLRQERPGMPVVFCTAYAFSPQDCGIPGDNVHVVHKPFQKNALLQALSAAGNAAPRDALETASF